jgi:hypothetical protein
MHVGQATYKAKVGVFDWVYFSDAVACAVLGVKAVISKVQICASQIHLPIWLFSASRRTCCVPIWWQALPSTFCVAVANLYDVHQWCCVGCSGSKKQGRAASQFHRSRSSMQGVSFTPICSLLNDRISRTHLRQLVQDGLQGVVVHLASQRGDQGGGLVGRVGCEGS